MLRSRFPLCLITALMVSAIPALAQDGKAPLQQIAAAENTETGLTLPTPAAIGTIVEAEGQGNLILRAGENDKAYPAKNGDLVYPNDTVQTGPKAKMLVLFIDDSRFTLGENARLRAEDYAYDDKNAAASKARYVVPQGSFLYAGGLMAKDAPHNNVKIQTAYGTINAPGTTVWGGALDDQYSVYAADGEAIIETHRGRIRRPGGEGTVIRSTNSIPERPVVWGAEKVDRAKTAITLADIESVKEKIAASQAKHADMLIRHKAYRNAVQQSRIEQQKPRDSIKRLDNTPQQSAAPAPPAEAPAQPATSEAEKPALTPDPLAHDTPAPSETPAAEAVITAPVSTPEPGPAKTLNDVSAPLPDAVPTTAEGAASASAPPKDTVPPPASDEQAQEAAAAADTAAQPAPVGATPSIIIEAETPVAGQPVEQNNVTPPAFPAPPPSIEPAPEDLPSDPAMRQEALEKLNLHSTGSNNPL